MTDLSFHVLGPVTVSDGPRALELGGPKQRTVLAVFVARLGLSVSADVLIDAVYGDLPHARARRTIQTYVSNLRSMVGAALERTAGGWSLQVDEGRVDASVFESRYQAAIDTLGVAPDRAGRELREALAMWTGHPFEDVEGHGVLDGEIARLDELRTAAQAARVDADLAVGRHTDLIGEIEALVAEHPFHERFRAQHMLALYRAGRQREALRSYSEMRTLLVDELGIEPTSEVRELERLILLQDPSLAPTSGPRIERLGVMVADPGDPLELARLAPERRSELLDLTREMVVSAARRHHGDVVEPAGSSLYATFRDPAGAVLAASDVVSDPKGGSLRIAVDFGDVESGESVAGPPVTRAARLVAAAHPGQVLLSDAAQQVLLADVTTRGIRVEALGLHRVAGMEPDLRVFQLLIGDPPRAFPPLDVDRVPPALPGEGRRRVPGYELRAPLVRGSVGWMYTAFQPSIRREVVVEVIGPMQSSDAAFIRRFEADVQRLALLEHSHILPILDYWRDTEGAFIVHPYPRGSRLLADAETLDCERVVPQIGAALQMAHEYGVVHGGLAPDRVLLDPSGKCSVFGFPLGGTAVPDPDSASFVAPEVFAGEVGAPADIYSLGVLAYTLLVGSEPDADRGFDLARVGDRVAPVLATALATDPSRRYRTIAAFVDALIPERAATSERYTASRNPYKGLEPFTEADEADFRGRSGLVEELVAMVGRHRLVTVIGPSGVGKSSLVRAGLVPAVRRGAIGESETWLVTDMVPGAQPFEELTHALERVAVALPNELRADMADRRRDALDRVESLLPASTRLLIVVDQLEEVFTLTPDSVRGPWLELLQAVSAADRVRVVATLRADFLDRALSRPAVAGLIRDGVVMVATPDRDELADAIVTPARRLGVEIRPDLSERLVADVADQPGALPLLQLTLTELFDNRASDQLTGDDLDACGGVAGAVARQAEAAFEALTVDARRTAQEVLLTLVGLADDDTPIRRRVAVGTLDQPVASTVIDAFTAHRLLVHSRHPVSRAPTIEVAHEAMFTHWPRLREWIEELRHDLVVRRHVNDAMTEWEEHGRDDGYLLPPVRASEYEDWLGRTRLAVSKAEAGYVERSVEHHRDHAAARRRRRRLVLVGFALVALLASILGVVASVNRERAEDRAAAARRAAERARDAESAARAQEESAVRSADVARARELAVSAAGVLDTDPELGIMLGVLSADIEDPPSAASSVLHQALREHRVVFTRELAPSDVPRGNTIGVLSPDGEVVVVAGFNGTRVEVWTVDEPSGPMWTADAPDGTTFVQVLSSADGSQIGMTVWDDGVWQGEGSGLGGSRIVFHDTATGTIVRRTDLGRCAASIHQRPGHIVDLDQPVVLTAEVHDPATNRCGRQTDVALLELATDRRQTVATLGSGIDLRTVVMSRDQRLISMKVPQQDSVVIDTRSGDVLHTLSSGNPAAISQDGSFVLTGLVPGGPTRDPGGLVVLAANDGTEIRRLVDETTSFAHAAFGAGDRLVYATADDGTIRIHDVATGIERTRLRGPVGGPRADVTMSADGSRLATFSEDGAVRVWDVATPDEVARIDLLTDPRWVHLWPGVQVAGDRAVVATAACECRLIPGAVLTPDEVADTVAVHAFDLDDGRELLDVPAGSGVTALQHGGERLAFRARRDDGGGARGAGGLVVTDVDTGDVITTMDGLCGWDPITGDVPPTCAAFPEQPFAEGLTSMAFSPDGRWLAAGGEFSKAVIVWDVTNGRIEHIEALADPEPPSASTTGAVPPTALAFSPDGALLVTSSQTVDGFAITVVDTATWTRVQRIPTTMPSGALAFDSNAEVLVAGDWNGVVTIYDPATWQPNSSISVGAPVSAISLSPSGSLLATGTEGGQVAVWDLHDDSVQETLSYDTRVIVGVHFLDEEHLLVAPYDSPLETLALDRDELVSIARSRITRGFTGSECATHALDPCPGLEALRDHIGP